MVMAYYVMANVALRYPTVLNAYDPWVKGNMSQRNNPLEHRFSEFQTHGAQVSPYHVIIRNYNPADDEK